MFRSSFRRGSVPALPSVAVSVPQQLPKGLRHGTSLGPQAVSIGLRNCYSYVASFRQALQASNDQNPWYPPQQLPKGLRACFAPVSPYAPQAVSIGLRNFYVARFRQAFKASNAPQQLPKGLRACFAMVPPYNSLASWFYWALKLLRGTFWASLKSLKWSKSLVSSAAASEGAPCLLCPGTSLGPTSRFYWASKLLRGTF